MKLFRKVALNSVAQFGGQAFSAVAGIVSVGVAARYLPPSQYGQIIAAMALVTLFQVGADFGVTSIGARVLAREPEKSREVSGSMMVANLVFTLPVVALIFVVSQAAYPSAGDALTRQAALVLLLTFAIKPLRSAMTAHAIVQQRIYLPVLTSMLARAISLGIVVAAAAADLGPMGVVAAWTAGIMLEDALATLVISLRLGVRPGRGATRTQVRALIAASAPLGVILVVNSLYYKIDTVMLSLLSTKPQVAAYGIAYRVFDFLAPLPFQILITLFPDFARMGPDDPRFRSLSRTVFTAVMLLVLPVAAIAVSAPHIIGIIGGRGYEGGAPALALIMVSVSVTCLQGVFGMTLVALGRQAPLLKVSLAVLVANVLINLALIPPFGSTGAGGALLVSELLSLAGTALVYRRVAPLPAPERPLRGLAAGAAMAGAACVGFALNGAVAGFVAAVALGLPVYVLALFVLRAVPEPVMAGVGSVLGRFSRVREAASA